MIHDVSSTDVYNCIKIMKQRYDKDISGFDEEFLKKAIIKRKILIESTEYIDYLDKNNKEADDLYDSLFVIYSQFYREQLSLIIFETAILPGICEIKSNIRIWSAGCGAGQEAYSLAILMNEYIKKTQSEMGYRIFATDKIPNAIDAAKKGIYHQELLTNLKVGYKDRYFTIHNNNCFVIPEIKKKVDFSVYDMLDNKKAYPPTSIYGYFDVIVCTNVMIYYKPSIQVLILEKIKKALAKGGVLITGNIERNIVEETFKIKPAVPFAPIYRLK